MLLKRLIDLPIDYSFFLFGARGTGKSTLLGTILAPNQSIYINLLNPSEELRFLKNPTELNIRKWRKTSQNQCP